MNFSMNNILIKNVSGNSRLRKGSPIPFHAGDKCRICLEAGDIWIFGEKNIAKDITEIAAIDILEYDHLPKFICQNCYTLLQSALLFKRTANKTHFLLKLQKEFVSDNFKYKETNDSVCSEFLDNSVNSEPFVKCEYLEVNEATEDSDTESEWKTGTQINDSISLDQDEEYSVEYLDIVDTDVELTESECKDKSQAECIDNKSCYTCNLTFDSPEELLNHENVKHEMVCEICKEAVNKTMYKVHMKLHRSAHKEKAKKNHKKIECEMCHKVIYKTYYKYHKKLVHGDEKEKAQTVTECPFCKKMFSSRNIGEHIRRAHDKITKRQMKNSKGQKKQCPICDRNVREENYKEHLSKHGKSNKDYVCETCGSKCATASALSTHVLTHGSELKYKCTFCPYRGLHLGLLKIHVRTHTKDYNYKCTLCPAKFITKSNLSIHMQRHTGIGKYKCEECDKTFYHKRNKENHYKAIHCTERNYKCDMCEKTFPHRDGMLSHQIKIHKREKLADHIGRLPTYLKNQLKSSEN